MKDKQQIADDLRGGAQYVRDHGWSRTQMRDSQGRVCAMGGIRCHVGSPQYIAITDWNERDFGAAFALAKHLQPDLFEIDWDDSKRRIYAFSVISRWNDQRAEGAEEVVTTMEKLAAKIEEDA